MATKTNTNKQFEFLECETCGSYPALFRWYNKKIECTECATRSFKKYLTALIAATTTTVGVIIGVGSILL